jgi:hypothetical protein
MSPLEKAFKNHREALKREAEKKRKALPILAFFWPDPTKKQATKAFYEVVSIERLAQLRWEHDQWEQAKSQREKPSSNQNPWTT